VFQDKDWFGSLRTQNRPELIKRRVQISPADRELMLRYGQEYFDGALPFGYGGYHYDGRFAPIVRSMIDHYLLNESSRVLDIGCAKGFLLYEFYRHGIPQVFGLDISDYAIANVPQAVRNQCFVGTASDLSRWTDGFFDLVIAKDVLHNLVPEEADKAIKEIVRVCKGAKFVQPNSYVTEHQRRCLQAWVITIKTVRSTQEWLNRFAELGYDGDYHFLTFDHNLD